jgi:hypothetical protein
MPVILYYPAIYFMIMPLAYKGKLKKTLRIKNQRLFVVKES